MTGIYQDGTSSSFTVYPYGEIVMMSAPSFYYISWTPSIPIYFSIDGHSYWAAGYFSSYSGIIPENQFWQKSSITYVEANAYEIGDGAFYKCSSLISVSFSKCKSIGSFAGPQRDGAFGTCVVLSDVYLPECEFIGNNAFRGCTSLSQISLPKCSYIGRLAFADCSSLSQISLPKCSYIGSTTFSGCQLTKVSLPECSFIGNNAFFNIPTLSDVSLPSCESIGSVAFGGAGLTKISLPMCSYLDKQVFMWCSLLSEVNLPVCGYIGSFTFDSCISLGKITLGSNSVCVLGGSTVFRSVPTTFSIYVPSSLVSAYKSAQYWSEYASLIYPINN